MMLPVILLFLVLLLCYSQILYRMVAKGKPFAKGSKKRRKKLYELFTAKKEDTLQRYKV